MTYASEIRNFNPRSHEGSDIFSGLGIISDVISILAPTRGATSAVKIILWVSTFQSSLPRGERHVVGILAKAVWDFNPRSHEGSDGDWWTRIPDAPISILAPTRGATLYTQQPHHIERFQSSLPRGERRAGNCFRRRKDAISILAPTRGATNTIPFSVPDSSISILAPTRGATCSP